MGKNIKLIMGILAGALVIFLCISVALYITKENERQRRILFEKKLAQTLAEKNSLEKELAELETVKGKLEKDYEAASNEVRSLQEGLKQAQAEKALLQDELQSKLADSNRRIDGLTKNLEEIGTARDELKWELERQKGECASLTELLNKTKQEKDDLEKKFQDLNKPKEAGLPKKGEMVTLEKITVKPETKFEGQVLVVNRDYNFLVTNLGKKQGVKVGDLLLVFRDNQLLSQVKVEKLYNGLSLGVPIDDWKIDTVTVGDVVRL